MVLNHTNYQTTVQSEQLTNEPSTHTINPTHQDSKLTSDNQITSHDSHTSTGPTTHHNQDNIHQSTEQHIHQNQDTTPDSTSSTHLSSQSCCTQQPENIGWNQLKENLNLITF